MKTSIRRITVTKTVSIDRPNTAGASIRSLDSSPGSTPPRNSYIPYEDLIDNNTSGTENIYSFTKTPTTTRSITVYINGILQRKDVDYTIDLVHNRLIFTENVIAESNIVAIYDISPKH